MSNDAVAAFIVGLLLGVICCAGASAFIAHMEFSDRADACSSTYNISISECRSIIRQMNDIKNNREVFAPIFQGE